MVQKITAWAQVQPITKQSMDLRPECEWCNTEKVYWLINGRSEGLTRTETKYTCHKCVAFGLTELRWN